MELQITVELDRDFNLSDGESRNGGSRRSTTKFGAGSLVRLGRTSDAFGLECTSSQNVTLGATAERASARIARELKASIAVER